jgi:hypothetical protein
MVGRPPWADFEPLSNELATPEIRVMKYISTRMIITHKPASQRR